MMNCDSRLSSQSLQGEFEPREFLPMANVRALEGPLVAAFAIKKEVKSITDSLYFASPRISHCKA